MRLLSQGIKTKKRVKDFGEVYTPAWLVRDMCNLAEPDISDPAKTALEPSCGNGNFLVEILGRKLKNCKDDRQRIMAVSNIYGVDILLDNIKECHDRLLNLLPLHLWGEAKAIFERNIIQGDFLKPDTIWFLNEEGKSECRV